MLLSSGNDATKPAERLAPLLPLRSPTSILANLGQLC